MKKIAIIGGGAAGMMAAVAATEQGEDAPCSVTLFEKNTYLGAKVIISGGGRCNVTTGILEVRELLKNYPRGAKFLISAMYRLPPEKVMQWFEEHGVPLKTEEDLRVFPVSNNGKDVVGALEKQLRAKGVEVMCAAAVTHTARREGKFQLTLGGGREFLYDALILTTGGNAYRHTGSTGDGYAFAQEFGHKITPLAPSLSNFIVQKKLVGELAGVSFEKVHFTLYGEANKKYERSGAFVFTHKGVSGPAVFALSALAAYEKISPQEPRALYIDFFPDEKSDAFEKRLLALIHKNPSKTLVNFLDILLPKSLCRVIAQVAQIDEKKTAGVLTKQERLILCTILKKFPLTVTGKSAGEEFVTAGGVDLGEVNTNTMESKICRNLYFAGELLDIDGFTGGFNLQSSWATGALAGEHAVGPAQARAA